MTTNQETVVTRQNIVFLPSQRLTDNDDGGGMPLGTPISADANELFNPVTTYDRAAGDWSYRGAYASIQRPDDAPLYKAFFAITKPASDPAVTYLAMESDTFSEHRVDVVKSITDNVVIDGTRYERAPTLNELHETGSTVLSIKSNTDVFADADDVLYLEGSYVKAFENSEKKFTYGEYVKVKDVTVKEVTKYLEDLEMTVTDYYLHTVTITKALKYTYNYDYILLQGTAHTNPESYRHYIYKTRQAGQARLCGAQTLTADISETSKTITVTSLTANIAPIVDGDVIDVGGIEVLQLPPDGLTQILHDADEILIINSQKDDLGTAHTGGATVQLSRTNVNRICVSDADNTPVNAALWSYDLAAGTVTWVSQLDLSMYVMPLTATHTYEELNRIKTANTDGTIELLHLPLRDYPALDTYVSSVLFLGNMQVRHSIPFTQHAWDGAWQDEPVGEQLTNKLNLLSFPMILTDEGAINERFMLRMLGDSQLEVWGERLGYLGKHDVLTDIVIVNPVTGKNILIIPHQAFGAEAPWAAQDIIRFDTWGTIAPIRLFRIVSPNRNESTEDGFTMCLFGDTTEI